MKNMITLITICLLSAANCFAQFSGGNGTKSSPYLISSKADWETFCNMAGNGVDMYFRLTQDIKSKPNVNRGRFGFSGYFDGGGHEIEVNMAGGLFSSLYSGAVIENLIVSGEIISARSEGVGGICNWMVGSATINKCHNKANISVSPNGSGGSAGGIVGQITYSWIYYGRGTISNCMNTGEITIERASNIYAGGIIGYNANDIGLTVSNCYNTGNIQGGISGGICGRAVSIGTRIENCFAANAAITCSTGGRIAGQLLNQERVINCYALSTMTINGSWNVSQVNGETTPNESFLKQSWITANLGWDFKSVWKQNSNEYPTLRFGTSAGAEDIPALRATAYVSNGSLHVDAYQAVTKVEVYDVNGRLVAQDLKFSDALDISRLPKGVYIVRMYASQQETTQKIVLR